jgi:hypothetical protein
MDLDSDPDPDSDPDSAIFDIDLLPSRRQKKINLKKVFFAYYFLKVHLHRFSKEVTKEYLVLGIKVWMIEGLYYRIRSRIRIREAQKHVDPDSEHCLRQLFFSPYLTPEILRFFPFKVFTSTSSPEALTSCWRTGE